MIKKTKQLASMERHDVELRVWSQVLSKVRRKHPTWNESDIQKEAQRYIAKKWRRGPF